MAYTNKDWQRELKKLLKRKQRTISFPSQNVMSRRIEGALGGEEEVQGFRAGIFYFKLSTLIDQETTSQILRFIYRNCKNVPQYKMATLFSRVRIIV